jgi:hypothetical protein
MILYCQNIVKPIFVEVVFKRFMEKKWSDAFNVVTKKQLNLQERQGA